MPVALSSSSAFSDVANPTYTPILHPSARYKSFKDFYPFYLGEHSVRSNRIMHIIGTSGTLTVGVYGVLCAIGALALRLRSDFEHVIPMRLRPDWGAKEWVKLAVVAIVQGYAWAWVGHALMERNRPATFRYPIWSLMGISSFCGNVQWRKGAVATYGGDFL